MNNPNYQQTQTSLPNAVTILVLGILSIVFCGLIGLVLGIIALSLSNKDKILLESAPQNYSMSSANNMKSGRTCAIIGVSLSAVATVFLIFYLIFVGTIFTTIFSNMGNCAY